MGRNSHSTFTLDHCIHPNPWRRIHQRAYAAKPDTLVWGSSIHHTATFAAYRLHNRIKENVTSIRNVQEKSSFSNFNGFGSIHCTR